MSQPAKMSSKSNDRELLAAIAAGSRLALEELYLAYHRRLARFVMRFTARYENAEEIINDTFLVVWQNAANFRCASQVSTWIFGIAYRVALKSVRRQKHHNAAVNIDDYPEQSEDPVLATEIEDWLAHGLDQLPLEQRMTLELAYHMGHSLEEIAVITDSPVGTVKARMFHARQKLRQYLPTLGGSAADLAAGVE